MCKACKLEMEEAYKYQEQGYNVGLEEIERGHLVAFIINKEEEVILI